MSHDAINSWVNKAKNAPVAASMAVPQNSGIQVIRREEPQSRGNKIMEIAEKLRPWFIKMFEGVRDDEGMLLQPAHIRGMALNVAQTIVKDQEKKAS